MADVTLTYKGQSILELSESGNKTIKTAGKYCESDISLAYVKSGGGSGYNILKGSSQPSATIGQDGDVYLHYAALDGEIENTYVKVNGAWQALVGSDVDDVSDSGMYTGIDVPPPASLGTDGDYYYQRIISRQSIQSVSASAIIYQSNTTAYGNEFTVTEPVTVTHLFARTVARRTGKLQIGTTAEMLAEIESVLFPAGEWVEVPLASPIQLSTGTNYVVKALVNSYPGYVSYVNSISDLTYDSKFQYVRARYNTSWPGTSESGICVLVGVSYIASDGVYRICKQFHKDSGSWSEIT